VCLTPSGSVVFGCANMGHIKSNQNVFNSDDKVHTRQTVK